MAASRVTSKNLFNFRPAGLIDADILNLEKEMMEKMGGDSTDWMAKKSAMTDMEYCGAIRGIMESMLGDMLNHPIIAEGENSCDHSAIKVPTNHDGAYDVTVLVHTPKAMALEKSRACIVYAHGGGVIGGTANLYKGFLSHMAMDCGVVVFNVDYRLAPETSCPNNVLDFYEVVKYVSSHAAELGVDPARIAIAGESGGGYICAGTMVQLARNGEGHMVKLAVPIIPMLSDYSFTDKAAMTKQESDHADVQQKIWRLIAGDGIESMRTDPLLYPGKADEETLCRMPPTIVWEGEFDFFITEGTRFANRLRAAGRLLELVVIPGVKHGSGCSPAHACFKLEREAWRVAMQEYLLK